jgi:glycosyltransferase involved in cell wall biosynthesis
MQTERRPHIVMEFGTDPGLDLAPGDTPGKWVVATRDYRIDPRPMFYRFTANHLSESDLTRFHMVTYDGITSALYSHMLSKPVDVLPLPQYTRDSIVNRSGRRPITVSVLGHQRADKGYHLMPQVARKLLEQEPRIDLLVHNGAPDEMEGPQQELRDLAAGESRLNLVEHVADPAMWQSLLRKSDLVLCPYQPPRYRASVSAVAMEAVANGIPVVVPAQTSMSDLLDRFGSPGTCFEQWEADAIVAATRRALGDFDTVAERAARAGAQWNATMGVHNMVERLLAYCQKG